MGWLGDDILEEGCGEEMNQGVDQCKGTARSKNCFSCSIHVYLLSDCGLFRN